MTTVARHFASTPERTATETWSAITNLLAPAAGAARDELNRAAGVISMLIADEVTKDRPLVVSGVGPQVRIYTVHGEDAIDGSRVSENALAINPTDGGWTLSVPVPEEDAGWIAGRFDALPHVTSAIPTAEKAELSTARAVPVIDLSELST